MTENELSCDKYYEQASCEASIGSNCEWILEDFVQRSDGGNNPN